MWRQYLWLLVIVLSIFRNFEIYTTKTGAGKTLQKISCFVSNLENAKVSLRNLQEMKLYIYFCEVFSFLFSLFFFNGGIGDTLTY